MFERYTEKARRAVFFARYEASQYGSAYIDTEHLLLGVLREDRSLGKALYGTPAGLNSAREEIEKYIVRGEPIPTSVEVPIAESGKQALRFAFEEAERLGHKFVGTEHLFLGLARVDQGVAATILAAHGMTLEKARGMIRPVRWDGRPAGPFAHQFSAAVEASRVLETFINTLRAGIKIDALECFAADAQYIDPQGRCWARKEILEQNVEELFGRFTTRNARHVLKEVVELTQSLCIGNVLWENLPTPGKEKEAVRMTVTLAQGEVGSNWLIYSVQTTPVKMNWLSEGI